MENKELLPSYLRFVKGVVDSADLPLNVSREILQHNKVIDKIRKATTSKILSELSKLAKKDNDKYQNSGITSVKLSKKVYQKILVIKKRLLAY